MRTGRLLKLFWGIMLLSASVIPSGVLAATENAFDEHMTDHARAVLVVEAEHGSVLVAKAPAAVLPIASLTKLMTALVFLDQRPRWNALVGIKGNRLQLQSRSILHDGDRMSLKDLFTTALVRSDNAAAQSLATATGLRQEEFVRLMNEKAASLELVDTHFVEPTGLAPENRSTARDLIHIAAVAFRTPAIAEVLKRRSAIVHVLRAEAGQNHWKALTVLSTNLIVGKRDNGFQILEGKTGTTDEAGYSFVVQAETLKNPKQHLLAVILAASSSLERFSLALDVLRFGSAKLNGFGDTAAPETVLQSASVQ